ncbi:pheromone A receptor-domain-containing protein [Mycena olivaceomarginata]|nr:pheromone A receptor-domain-containing protein [Mycena olivaceomarginata]
MLPILPVLSFLCAGLLAVFLIILLRRPTLNTSNISIVLWLLLGNVVHAVNALVWSSNVDTTRIPVWCDIVTKLLVGATAALPGVCLCSARYLELLSSHRKIYPNTYSKRLHTLIDVALCYVLPLLYMTLHFAVQDHRFDLVQDLGCSASIHRSTPAILIMTISPLILCSISLVLCLLSVWNCARLSSSRFISHLSARSALSPPLFVRRLAKSILLTTAVFIVTLLPLLSPRTQRWATFHANFALIYIVRNPDEVRGAQTVWWAIPVVSIVYLVLSLGLGACDEGVDALSWVRRRFPSTGPPQRPVRPELSRLTFSQHAMVSKSSLLVETPSLATPQPVQLRSGWDDMLDVKQNSRRNGFIPTPNRKSVVSSADSDYAPSSSPSPTTPEDDDAFTSSTLTYLASPIAQALGLESPVTPTAGNPFPAATGSITPTKSGCDTPCTRTPSPPRPAPPAPAPAPARHLHLHPPRQPIPEDTASTISSIWDAPWPLPPASPSSLRAARPQSPTLSDHMRRAVPVYVPAEPPGVPPFEGSSVPGRRKVQAQGVPRKSILKPPSVVRGLGRAGSRAGKQPTDVIYMTRSVEETVTVAAV